MPPVRTSRRTAGLPPLPLLPPAVAPLLPVAPTIAPAPVPPTAPTERITSLVRFKALYPTANKALYFPGLPGPARDIYAKIHSTPLPVSDKSFMIANCSYEDIHRRLLRLLPKAPSVAVYPYIIAPIKRSALKFHRNHHIKIGPQKYCFTLSSFIAWPLGDRKVRMGVVMSPVEDSRQTNDFHAWAFALVNKSDGRGKSLVIFDSDHMTVELVRREDFIRGQRTLIDLIKKDHKYQLDEVWWSNSRAAVGVKGFEACWETSLRFMEKFAGDVERNGGRVTQTILDDWEMMEITS